MNMCNDNQSVVNHLNEWLSLYRKQNNDGDKWTTIPILPQYRFKNLKTITEKSNDNEITITLQCDYYTKVKLCDSCGKEFTGKSFPMKNDYTLEFEDGLIQCEKCYENEIT